MKRLEIKIKLSGKSSTLKHLLYQLSYGNSISSIKTDMKLSPDEWDGSAAIVKSYRSETAHYEEYIRADVQLLYMIASHLKRTRCTDVVGECIKRFGKEYNRSGFLSFMMIQIEQMKSLGRMGTANNYLHTLYSFLGFIDGYNLSLGSMSEALIAKYSQYLVQKGMKRNSISFYMRNLRAVYNKAVGQGLLSNNNHPFVSVYTGVDNTRKRAVKHSVISLLYKLDVFGNYNLQLAKDIFLFSYFTRGMSFVDIAFLKRTSLKNGYISYYRHKTGQLLNVKVEPAIQNILERYSENSRYYLFPILVSANYVKAYDEYKVAINRYNRNLKILSVKLNLEVPLTSYVARHSWATTARDSNIPIYVISAALGHTSEKTTRIYLSEIDNRVVDDASRLVMDLVLV